MPNYLKCVQIKAEYNQLLEMATAFGVRVLGTALVVILDSTDFRDKGPEWAPSPIIAAGSKWTTKAVPSTRTPKAPPIYVQGLIISSEDNPKSTYLLHQPNSSVPGTIHQREGQPE